MSRPSSLAILALLAATAFASGVQKEKDTSFQDFFTEFQDAVKTGDKEKVADFISFDLFHWQGSDALRMVRTRESFLENYDRMFTLAIRNRIAQAKPKKDEYGTYSIVWRASDFDIALSFPQDRNGNYVFDGLTARPIR